MNPSNPYLSSQSPSSQYDKQRVALKFGKAAGSYTDYDHLQRNVAASLMQRIQPLHSAQATLLDVGCGPAHHSASLRALGGHYLGLDIAPAMLIEAQRQQGVAAHLIGADMEQLPLRDACVDLLFSNLAMQWSNNPKALLEEWFRVLAPGGQVSASTVLAGSLQPLGSCFAAIDGRQHTNQWHDFATFAAQVKRLPWQVHCEQIHIVQEFDTLETMLRELKGVGANYTARATSGLYGRERFLRLKEALEEHRNTNGKLELHWSIGILTGVKPLEEIGI